MPSRHAKDWGNTECHLLGQQGKGHIFYSFNIGIGVEIPTEPCIFLCPETQKM